MAAKIASKTKVYRDMKIVKNRFIPPRGFSYVNLFGVLFTRRDRPISDKTLNHEQIHTEQMKEMLYVFFYIWYVILNGLSDLSSSETAIRLIEQYPLRGRLMPISRTSLTVKAGNVIIDFRMYSKRQGGSLHSDRLVSVTKK